MVAAHILRLTWTYSRVRIAARVGPLTLLCPLCNSRAGSSLFLISPAARRCFMSALNDKAFFVAASARDTQSKALMLVSFAGVLFLEVTLNFIASGSTPHSPCAHLERATSAITSKRAGNELDELKRSRRWQLGEDQGESGSALDDLKKVFA